MSPIEIPNTLLIETIEHLKSSVERERVVLWLGRRHEATIQICEVFLPMQETSADYFRIPAKSMSDIFAKLRAGRLMIAAQVHTHPNEAFHSAADDHWAIVRHRGAVSIVVPDFCQRTSAHTFTRDALTFQLDEHDQFTQVDASSAYTVTP